MARPRTSEQRDTRREILDAALDLFGDKGFHGTSLRDIARAVGVRESALYHHFPSKEALFEAILLPELGPADARVVPELPAHFGELAPFFERLAVTLLERFLTLKERKRFRVMLAEGVRLAADGRVNYWERMAAMRGALTDVMGQLQSTGLLRPGDPEFLAASFMAPIFLWRHVAALSPGHRFIERYKDFAHEHAEQFLRGAVGEG